MDAAAGSCLGCPVMRAVEADYLEAHPFVRLHQSSAFYGVASTVLGGGRIQERGPEAGLHQRADQPTICAYYSDLLERMPAPGRVELFAGCEYVGEHTFVSRVSGQRFEVPERCRIVDAHYLAPDIPAETPPRFEVPDGARVVPVNDLVRCAEAPSQYVVVGSGKTATDACVWLLARGVDPDAICWVRPREPWMLNRALIQPDPVIYLGMVADMFRAAGDAASLPELFLRLEDAGIMMRIDRSVAPTMARTPTLETWELELLRSIEHVVRLGHTVTARRGRLDLEHGSVDVADRRARRELHSGGPEDATARADLGVATITVQPIRAGFPCFGSEPDIKAGADRVALNPARIPPEHGPSADLDDAVSRLQKHVGPGLARLAEPRTTSCLTDGTRLGLVQPGQLLGEPD